MKFEFRYGRTIDTLKLHKNKQKIIVFNGTFVLSSILGRNKENTCVWIFLCKA